jgi:broad specificity phosphatase PhoE
MRRVLASLSLACLALVPPARAADDEAQLLALVKSGGQVVLMRHTTTTPGVGDPAGMTFEDCSTQRNLTDEGRRQAKAIGERLRAAEVQFDRVASSPFCRCKETAQLVFGRIDEVAAPTARGEREVRDMRAFASEKRRGSAVLVSHATTIRNAIGVDTAPGDMVVVTPLGDGRYEIRGKIVGVR